MSPSTIDVRNRLEFATQAAVEAGKLTLEYFQNDDLAVERKSDNSPVTVADKGAEQLLRRLIKGSFPKDGIIGEEFGEEAGTSGFRWILDPIDGTKSFIGGVPLYSTLIGIMHGDRSYAGVIRIPGLDEMVYAAKGEGAWYRKGDAAPVAARVSSRSRLSDGFFLTSQVDTYDTRGAGGAYARLQKAAYVTRTWGDGYGYLLVATGRAEVMVDPRMYMWDIAALLPIMEEAGGTLTDWNGVATIEGGEAVATNRHVLEEVLAITRDFPRTW